MLSSAVLYVALVFPKSGVTLLLDERSALENGRNAKCSGWLSANLWLSATLFMYFFLRGKQLSDTWNVALLTWAQFL